MPFRSSFQLNILFQVILTLEEKFTAGEDAYFDSKSPVSSLAVVFEDDLTTAYFYAVDTKPELQILDALHIYDVANVVDRDKPSIIKIAWSEDGTIALLLINDYCHAAFDFSQRAGFCRTAFPDCNDNWCKTKERLLSDSLLDELLQKVKDNRQKEKRGTAANIAFTPLGLDEQTSTATNTIVRQLFG